MRKLTKKETTKNILQAIGFGVAFGVFTSWRTSNTAAGMIVCAIVFYGQLFLGYLPPMKKERLVP